MKKFSSCLLISAVIFLTIAAFHKKYTVQSLSLKAVSDTVLYPQEKHFKNIRQLTFGGDNAEAYFSFDRKYLIFKHKSEKQNVMCDQMYIGKIPETADEKFEPKMISSGKG